VFALQKACTSLAFGTEFVAAGVMIAGVGVQFAFLLAGLMLAAVLVVTAPRLRREWPSPSVRPRTQAAPVAQPAPAARR
jgi:Na+-transporting methylmalonyl-CoA/oxaloacetate decarboxylase gamma subunit